MRAAVLGLCLLASGCAIEPEANQIRAKGLASFSQYHANAEGTLREAIGYGVGRARELEKTRALLALVDETRSLEVVTDRVQVEGEGEIVETETLPSVDPDVVEGILALLVKNFGEIDAEVSRIWGRWAGAQADYHDALEADRRLRSILEAGGISPEAIEAFVDELKAEFERSR